MRWMITHFVNEDTNQEYVTFEDADAFDGTFDHGEFEAENARPGFKLKGAWAAELERMDNRYKYFLPGESDVYMMDR